MSYRKVTKTLIKVAKEYMADNDYATQCMSDEDMYNKLKPLGTDGRDLVPMLFVWGIHNKGAADRATEIKEKMLWLRDVFKNPDPKLRKPYLDMIYDLRDNFDPDKIDMNKEDDVHKLMQCMLLSQTFATKMEENPDYYNARYPDPNQRRLADAKNIYYEKVVMYTRYNLAQPKFDGKSLKINPGKITFASPLSYTNKEVYDCATGFAKLRLEKVQEEIRDNKPPSNVYEVPVLDSMMLHAGKDVEKISQLKKEDSSLFESYSSFVIGSSLLARANKNMQGMVEAGFGHDMDAVYVDGMPFAEFRKAKFPDKSSKDELNHNILANLLLNPNHRVDIIHSYRDEKGVMQYEPKTLKAAITPKQEKLYLKQFNWFHRTFFNRGRFRIEPLKEKLDRIATDPNSPEVKARYEKICANMKERVETAIEKKKEEARLAEIKDAREEAERQAFREAFKTETERVKNAAEHSLEKYGANSVVSILGQQVKDSYNDIIQKTTNSAKYEAVAEIFAKQVLFTLLCTERVSQADAIGPREQALMGNTEEAIKENIETFAKNMAKDPVLKESLFNLMGDAIKEDKINRDAVKQMIMNGGCKALATAYNEQKMAEDAQKKQVEGIQNQMNVQKQGAEIAQPKESVQAPFGRK